jgi:hypothetical protein
VVDLVGVNNVGTALIGGFAQVAASPGCVVGRPVTAQDRAPRTRTSCLWGVAVAGPVDGALLAIERGVYEDDP